MSVDPSPRFEAGESGTSGLEAFGHKELRLPECSTPLVSVVIPVFNQLECTLDCLHSLAAEVQRVDFEVIVVDDCSGLPVFQVLSSIPGLRVLRNFENLGFVRSCNRGAFNALGKYLLFLNNDTEVTEGWLAALLRIFELHPDAGLVGAKLVYPDGSLQEAGGIIWQDGSGWNYGNEDDPTLPWYNYVKEVDYCSGACVLVPRTVWERTGGFDLLYSPAYYEDTDLAFKVRELGLKVYYQPHARVIHHEGKSHGIDPSSGGKKFQVENHSRFVERWGRQLGEQFPVSGHVFKARERGAHKKTLLLIDHHLPLTDQDAGSRNIFHYLQFFLRSGFSVKFLPDDFQPRQPYQYELEELGVEVLSGHYMREHITEWIEANGSSLDYVLFSRAHTCEPWVRRLAPHTKAAFLFYGHDLLSRTYLRAYRDFGDPRHFEHAREAQGKEDFMIRSCAASFYPSQVEVGELRLLYPDRIIEAVPLYVYEARDRSRDLPVGSREGLLFVGSASHPPNLDAIEWMLFTLLPVLRVRLPGVQLHLVGKPPPQRLLERAGDGVVFHGQVSEAELVALYRRCRVALAPLRMGGGLKGKILEAYYQGLPVASTPIGLEGIATAEKVSLRVPPGEDFAQRLVEYYQDLELLERHTEAAYELVLRSCSFDAVRSAFSKAIPELKIAPSGRG